MSTSRREALDTITLHPPAIEGPEDALDPWATIREYKRRIAEYERLLDLLPVGVTIARDAECRSIVSNRRHASLLGCRPDQNTSIDPRASDGAAFRVFRDGVELGADELPMHRAIAEKKEILNVECEVIKEGSERVCLVGHAAPIFDENDGVCGAVGAFIEITERKLAEETLAESERRYREVARENARLYEEAQAAVRVRDRFLATASHELRAPIATILTWATLLRREGRTDAKIANAVDAIERSAMRQERLVEDILDAFRMTNGPLRMDCRETDLASIVSDSIQTLSAVAARNDVSLVSNVATTPIALHGDPDRLHQVAWNLISNAIKFAPSGEVRVEVHRDEDEAVLRVTDNGSGIADTFLPHVFEQFSQAPGNRASVQGLGLGLAIVRHIVELHGGRVAAHSEGLGKGATFVVSLPIRRPGESFSDSAPRAAAT